MTVQEAKHQPEKIVWAGIATKQYDLDWFQMGGTGL